MGLRNIGNIGNKRIKGSSGHANPERRLLLAVFTLWTPSASYAVHAAEETVPGIPLDYLLWGGIVGLLAATIAWFVSRYTVGRMTARGRPASSGLGRLNAASPPQRWTLETITSLDRLEYERLCEAIWRLKGLSIESTETDAGGAVNFYLTSGSSQTRVGAARCLSRRKRKIGMKALNKMHRVIDTEQIEVGLLMYRGTLTTKAAEFVTNPEIPIQAHGPDQLLSQLMALPTAKQKVLLQTINAPHLSRPLSVCRDIDFEISEQL